MALNITGFNIHPQDRWEDRASTNQFKIDGLTVNEWLEKDSARTKYNFWSIRNARISEGAKAIFEARRQKQAFPMDIFAVAADTSYGPSLQQMSDAMPQWDKLVQMSKKKSGTIYGIDIETIGDIQNSKGVFGITEIGISKINLAEGVRDTDAKSIVLGLNKQQQEYVYDLIKKYEHEGWSTLNKTEQSTLKRASMYRGELNQIFHKESVVDVGNILGTDKLYTVVDELASVSMNPEDMRKGVENLRSVYLDSTSNAHARDVLGDVIDFIGNQFYGGKVKSDRIIYAANGNFDITGLRNYAKLHGISIKKLENMDNQLLDNVNIIRTVATASDQSVSQWFQETYGIAAGADIESQMKAFGMSGTQLHSGGSDLINEARILLNEDIDIYDIYRDVISEYVSKGIENQRTLAQSNGIDGYVYYVHHGALNKENADEFAYVPTKNGGRRNSANYAITQEFWTINTEKSGEIKVGDDTKYRLVLDNYAEQVRRDIQLQLAVNDSSVNVEDVTSIVLTGNTADEVKRRLDYMADRYTDRQVRSIAEMQQNYHYRDFGRREYEKMFSPMEVMLENGIETGGYAAIKKNLETEKMIREWENIHGDLPPVSEINSSTARTLYEAANEMSMLKARNFIKDEMAKGTRYSDRMQAIKNKQKEFMPFNTDYEAQSFLGMRKKLQDEQHLLEDIVKAIDRQPGSVVDKTILARNIYNDVMQQVISEYKTDNKADAALDIMTDITGIDILTGVDSETNEPIISRINGRNQKTISNDIQRRFERMNESEIKASLRNLQDREIIDDAQKYINMVEDFDMGTKSGYESDIYFMSQDIGFEISKKFDDDAFFKGTERGNRIIKNLQLETDKKVNLMLSNSNGDVKLRDALLAHEDYIKAAITRHSSNAPSTVYMNKSWDVSQIKSLLTDLGMDADNKHNVSLMFEMFQGGGNPDSKYGISQYQGLQSYLVRQDKGKDAYLFITRDKDSQKLYDALTKGIYNFDSFGDLIQSGGDEFGAVIRLPHINSYNIGDGHFMKTMNQGKTLERFMIPKLEMRSYKKDGKDVWSVYLNDADHTALSMYRTYGESFLRFAQEGKYDTATRVGRRKINNYLQDMPTSATYRNNGGQVRTMHPGPNDYMHGYEFYGMEGLEDIFKHIVTGRDDIDKRNLNVAQQIVQSFADKKHMSKFDNETQQAFYNRVMKDNVFQQFLRTRMTIGTIGEDALNLRNIPEEVLNKNLFNIIKTEVVQNGEQYGFAPSAAKAFETIETMFGNELFQVGSESAVHKGSLFGVNPGEYSVLGGLTSTMRPVWIQQYNNVTYDPVVLKQQAKEKMVGLSSSRFNPISFGNSPLEMKEYIPMNSMRNYGMSEERSFMAKFRYMSDQDLQKKLKTLTLKEGESFRNDVINTFGLTDDKYLELVNYAKSNIFSFHEDKGIHAPGLKETDLLAAREAMTYSFNLDILDEERTEEALNEILAKNNGLLKSGDNTIIAYKKNGNALFYNGPEAILTQDNINDLIYNNDGVTKLALTRGSIVDDKFMLNGSEKFTSHTSLDVERVKQITGLGYDKALELANRVHGYVFDGAVFALNPKSAKHGSDNTSISTFLTIYRGYEESGNGNVFVQYLNNLIDDKSNTDLVEGLNKFAHVDGSRLVGNLANARYGARFVEKVLADVRNNASNRGRANGLIRDISKSIIEELDEMDKKNMPLGLVTRQNMTEFIGEKYRMDQRTDQSMRMRGMTYSHDGGNGVLKSSARIADDLKQYSMAYNGKGTGLKEAGYETLQGLVDAVSAAKNYERIGYNTATNDMQRTVRGIVEVANNFSSKDPISSSNIRNKNIVTLDIYDLIDSLNIGRSGSTTEELQSGIFFVNGAPSKLLEQRAMEQGKDLYDRSYSIFIKMNREFEINGKKTDGFLIPIQSVNGALIDDKHYFQNQQKETTSFINKAVRTILEPGDNDFGKLVNNYTDSYIPTILKELDYMKKDADITKAFQQYIVPTSTYMLGQDETSPLLKSQMGRKWQSAINKLHKAEIDVRDNFANQDSIDNYAEALAKFNEMIKADADAIDEGTLFSQYQALSSGYQKKFGDALIIKDANGMKHHGMGITMSEEAFERSGFDFGATAMDLVADMEKMEGNRRYAGAYEGMRKFNTNHRKQLQKLKEDIADIEFRYIGLDSNGIETEITRSIDPTKALMPQLEEIFTDSKMLGEDWGVTAKKLNEEIAQGSESGFLKVFRMFKESGIAQDYMSEVGTYTQFLRSPIFRSQLVMKAMLDKSLDGYQVRSLDAVTSMITNLDFDGDIPAILQRLNGMSIMKNTEQAFKDYAEEWIRFAVNDHHHLLADLVRDGAPFRREIALASNLQQATLLKIVDEESYNRGIDDFLKTYEIFDNVGNRVNSFNRWKDLSDDVLKDAIEFAADNSDVMSNAFNDNLGNTLKNEKMTLAAYAAKIRKDYIGSVSTPAYKLRATLLDTMNNESLTQEQKNLLNDVLVGMSNMFSENGGFLSVSEQRGIDTKWAKDAQKYSQLSDWANSMVSLLRNKDSKYRQQNIYNNVKDMIEAVGVNVFKFKPDDTVSAGVYTDIIIQTTSDEFRKHYLEAKRTGEKIDFKGFGISLGRDEIQELWSMHDLVEAINKVPQLSQVFKERYDGDAAVEFAKKVSGMSEDAFADLVKQTANAPVHDVLSILHESISKDTFTLDPGRVYYDAGSLFDKNPDHTLYMYKGSGKFAIIDPDASVISPKNSKVTTEGNIKYASVGSANVSDAIKEIFSKQTDNPMISELRHSGAVQESLKNNIESSMIANTLNKIILDDDGVVREHEWSRFSSMLSKRWKDKDVKAIGFGDLDRGNATIDALGTMFGSLRGSQYVYDEVRNFAKAYDYAASRGDMSGNSAELIRAINKKIADDGWKDHSGINVNYYDVMLKPYIMQAMGGEDNYNKYLDMAINLPDFSKPEYDKAIASLRNKAYDINSLKEAMSGQYDRALAELNDLPHSGYTEDDLKPIRDFLNQYNNQRSRYIDQKINSLQQDNVNIAADAEQAIYKMFRNSDQLDKHFGFGQDVDADDMIVGFGELMGVRFKGLSQNDIDYIMDASFDTYATNSMDAHTKEMLRHAIEQTQTNLDGYKASTKKSAFSPTYENTHKVNEVIKNAEAEMSAVLGGVLDAKEAHQQAQDVVENAADAAGKAASEAAKETAESMKQKTLRSELFSGARETFESLNINKKTVGVVAGALAALGILNNVIHSEKPQSPLSPARTSKNNNDPYLNNKETQFQAPPSPQGSKTVYHHNGSGLNFRVSAKTKKNLDDQSRAKLIGMAGGGQPSIHTYTDTSGVSDNWLQNKFAELMN